jgi:TIR domain
VRAFISYAKADVEAVSSLHAQIEQLVGDAWIDTKLTGGQEWWDEIVKQIQDRDLFIFAISEGSVRSEACLTELSYAIALGKPVLPVRIDNVDASTFPDPLRRLHFVPFDPATDTPLAAAIIRFLRPPKATKTDVSPPSMPSARSAHDTNTAAEDAREALALVIAPELVVQERVLSMPDDRWGIRIENVSEHPAVDIKASVTRFDGKLLGGQIPDLQPSRGWFIDLGYDIIVDEREKCAQAVELRYSDVRRIAHYELLWPDEEEARRLR